MRAPDQIRSGRLLLRRWRPEDLDPFAAMSADPEVMEHFPSVLGRAETFSLQQKIEAHWTKRGFGLWALELPGMAPFIGFAGLSVPGFEAPFTPCVEIGWRLARAHWGHGYATEAADSALEVAFGPLALDEVVSFTVPGNVRSRRVMERLRMAYEGEFDHPSLAEGHRLRRHVLYRLPRARWAAA